MVPPAPPTAPGLKIETNVFASTWHILKAARHGRGVWLSILGISWFFAVGAVLLAEFAPLVANVLHARQDVATLFLLIFLGQRRARRAAGQQAAQGRGLGALRAGLGAAAWRRS